MTKSKYLAAIMLRSIIGLRPKAKKTLIILKLKKKNSCVIVPDTPKFRGMMKMIKDYVAWGEIDEKTLQQLKKSRKPKEGKITLFHLHPPRGGLRSVKRSFQAGGDLGYRADKINELIGRML